jgi:hypothetical protein
MRFAKVTVLLALLCGIVAIAVLRSPPAAEAVPGAAGAGQRVLHIQCATVEGSSNWASADFDGKPHRIAFDVFVPVAVKSGASMARVQKDGYVLEMSWSAVRPAGGTDAAAVTFDQFTWEVRNKLLVRNDSIHFGRNSSDTAFTFGAEFVPLNSPVALGGQPPTVVIRGRVTDYPPAAADIRLPLPEQK